MMPQVLFALYELREAVACLVGVIADVTEKGTVAKRVEEEKGAFVLL